MGSRSATNEKALAWAAEQGANASTGTFADAVDYGDLIVVASLGTATESIITDAGPSRFRGKIVIDTTNPLEFTESGPRLFVGHTDSLGERVQRLIPEAHVVKAFNTIGNAYMYKPQFPGGPPDMFIAGDDERAKDAVSAIIRQFGLEPIDLGGIESSRYLEPLCIVWVRYGFRTNTWNHAFKMLRI
jgi:predicted dinucleotide-binding enzyme